VAFPESLRSNPFRRAALGVAAAGLGTCAFAGYVWWSARGGLPTPDVSAVILIVIPIGVSAGLISGRYRDAPASWIAAVIGSVLAYQATYAIDPSLPTPHSSFTGNELLSPVFLFPFIAGGHLLGVWARTAGRRGLLGAAFAGVAICAYAGIGYWSSREGGPPPGGYPDILIWIAIGSWVAIGAIAGLVSGRLRDAPASWASAVIGFMLAYLVFYGIEEGSDGPVETLLYTPLFLLPIIAGGHLLGATLANRSSRSLVPTRDTPGG
jgi:hypothetical protein